MATFVFKCAECGVFFATLSAMQSHRCLQTMCTETARETDKAPEDSEEVEVNSEQPATQTSVESTLVSWSKASTKLLIAEMVRYKEKLNAGAMKKKTVMNMICQKLHQNNYFFTEDQVTGRWKTLVRAYKAVKDGQNKSGSGRKTYEYQQELDEYFQGDPIVKPLAIATSGSSSTEKRAMEEESDDHEIESVESQPKRKRNSASENHGFLDLPVTIIEEIFSFIPQKDWWKTLRFVCKSFEQVVFHKITCATIKEGDFPSHSFIELKKLQELKVIFECCSLTGSEFLENIEKLSSLKTLKLVGSMFTYTDMMHLCCELQFMNITCLIVESSIQNITPACLEYVIENIPSLKSISLPLVCGYDNQLSELIEKFAPKVFFGHQVLDAVKPVCLGKPRSAYLQN